MTFVVSVDWNPAADQQVGIKSYFHYRYQKRYNINVYHVFSQALARVWRDGQKKDCKYIKLIYSPYCRSS